MGDFEYEGHISAALAQQYMRGQLTGDERSHLDFLRERCNICKEIIEQVEVEEKSISDLGEQNE